MTKIDWPDWISPNSEVEVYLTPDNKGYSIKFIQPERVAYKRKWYYLWIIKERFVTFPENSWTLAVKVERKVSREDYIMYSHHGYHACRERLEKLRYREETMLFDSPKTAIEFLINTDNPWFTNSEETTKLSINLHTPPSYLNLSPKYDCPPINNQEVWTIIFDWLELALFDKKLLNAKG